MQKRISPDCVISASERECTAPAPHKGRQTIRQKNLERQERCRAIAGCIFASLR